jgi:tetratricopeptide (TPR) repeat protein
MNRILFILLFISSVFYSCGQPSGSMAEEKSGVHEVDIPALLPRPVVLQDALEWERAQSGYMQLSSELRLKDPNAVEPRITIAKIFVNEARVTGEHGHYYPAALQLLNEALELNASIDKNLEFEALATKAGVQLSQHDFADARRTAIAAIKINPMNAQVYGALVDANVELGRYEEAVAMADKMTSIRPDLRSYSRISYLREIHGDVDGSIEALQSAIKAGYPGYESTAWARLTLGELYQRYGMKEEARKQFDQILVERPNYPFAIAALGSLEMEAGDFKVAEQLLDSAAAIIPEVGFYVQLAELYKATGRMEDLQAIQKEIMVMLQDDVDSGHNMDMEYATLYRDLLDNNDKALEYARQEYEQRPDNIDVNRLMAGLLAATGQMDEARIHLEKAEMTDSKHPELAKLKKAMEV